MSGRLVLVRHGQTVANVAKALDTRPPGAPLTDEGVEQARRLGQTLVREPLAALVSSTALRAQQTARAVAESTRSGLQVVDGLFEVQVGDLEGRSDEEAHRRFIDVYTSWHHGDLDARLPGGESGRDALARYVPVLDELRDGYLSADASSDVVVVSHGAIIRLAVAALTGVGPGFADTRHLSNTESVALVPHADGSWECVRWGSVLPPFAEPAREVADDPMG